MAARLAIRRLRRESVRPGLASQEAENAEQRGGLMLALG